MPLASKFHQSNSGSLTQDQLDFFNFSIGAYLDDPVAVVISDGATITLSLEDDGGGDLRIHFSDGVHVHDCTPADTIALTAGSDSSPQVNYVYIPQSTKVLTVSTAAFPAAEHAPVAVVFCQSAASLQTDGAYKVHAWTDHLNDPADNGHLSHLNSRARGEHAPWKEGVDQTLTITTNGGSADNVIFTSASGVVRQLHEHVFPAFSGTPDIYVINDSVTPYTKVTDLNALLTDSLGVSMSGRFFSLVIWGVVNEATGDCKLFCNLPGGSYNTSTGVEQDANKYANFNIPVDFRGTGFLISELKLRHQATASGTWTSVLEQDLRGFFPATAAGSGVAGATEFIDNVFRILDEGDATKEIAFQASGITTGNVRVITMPDKDVDLGDIGSMVLLDAQIASGSAVITMDNKFTSAFDSYLLVASKVSVATDAQDIVVTLRSAVPADIADSYEWANRSNMMDSAGGADNGNNNGTAGWLMQGEGSNRWGNQANEAGSFGMTIHDPLAAAYTDMTFDMILDQANNSRNTVRGGGVSLSTTPAAGLEITSTSGNFSGKFRLYGFKNS